MGKLNNRIIAIILLVVWCTVVYAGNWNPQYRSVVADTPDAGKIVFFIIYVIIGEYAKRLDSNYRCPVYCEVNHKHIYGKNEIKIKQSIDEKADSLLLRPVIAANR
jgi:hypothetical protein